MHPYNLVLCSMLFKENFLHQGGCVDDLRIDYSVIDVYAIPSCGQDASMSHYRKVLGHISF